MQKKPSYEEIIVWYERYIKSDPQYHDCEFDLKDWTHEYALIRKVIVGKYCKQLRRKTHSKHLTLVVKLYSMDEPVFIHTGQLYEIQAEEIFKVYGVQFFATL